MTRIHDTTAQVIIISLYCVLISVIGLNVRFCIEMNN